MIWFKTNGVVHGFISLKILLRIYQKGKWHTISVLRWNLISTSTSVQFYWLYIPKLCSVFRTDVHSIYVNYWIWGAWIITIKCSPPLEVLPQMYLFAMDFSVQFISSNFCPNNNGENWIYLRPKTVEMRKHKSKKSSTSPFWILVHFLWYICDFIIFKNKKLTHSLSSLHLRTGIDQNHP